MTAAMTSRRSMRSEIAAIGKTPSADPNTMEDVITPHADAEGENRSEREQAAVRSAAASTAQHESGAMRMSQRRRGRTCAAEPVDRRWSSPSAQWRARAARHRLRKRKNRLPQAASAPVARLRKQRSLQSDSLIEGVEDDAIGVGRLGVDPGLDHRIEAGEHEADERAAAEPGPLGNEDGHEDHRNDGERHKGRESPDMPAPDE